MAVPFHLHGLLALHPCEEAWRHGCRGRGSDDLVGNLVVTGGAGEPCKSMHEHAGVKGYLHERAENAGRALCRHCIIVWPERTVSGLKLAQEGGCSKTEFHYRMA